MAESGATAGKDGPFDQARCCARATVAAPSGNFGNHAAAQRLRCGAADGSCGDNERPTPRPSRPGAPGRDRYRPRRPRQGPSGVRGVPDRARAPVSSPTGRADAGRDRHILSGVRVTEPRARVLSRSSAPARAGWNAALFQPADRRPDRDAVSDRQRLTAARAACDETESETAPGFGLSRFRTGEQRLVSVGLVPLATPPRGSPGSAAHNQAAPVRLKTL